MNRPRRSDGTASHMDGEAGWWTTSRKIGPPPLARAKGMGRQQHILRTPSLSVSPVKKVELQKAV